MANEAKIEKLFEEVQASILNALTKSYQLKKELAKDLSEANPIFGYMKDLRDNLAMARKANENMRDKWYE